MSWKTKNAFVFVFVLMAASGYAAASRSEDSHDPSRFTYARLYCTPEGAPIFRT